MIFLDRILGALGALADRASAAVEHLIFGRADAQLEAAGAVAGVGGAVNVLQAVAQAPTVSAPKQGMVFHLDRVQRDCTPGIVAFFEWWNAHGPFPITVADGDTKRDDAYEAELHAEGRTNATSAKDSPHGTQPRAAGVDTYPAIVKRRADGSEYVAEIYLAEQPGHGATVPEDRIRPDLFRAIQARAKEHGLECGGDWKNLYGFGPEGDAGHLQEANWRKRFGAKAIA